MIMWTMVSAGNIMVVMNYKGVPPVMGGEAVWLLAFFTFPKLYLWQMWPRIKFKTLWMTVLSYIRTTKPLKSHLYNVKTTFLFTPQATSTWSFIWNWGDWRNPVVHGNVSPVSMDNCISVSLQRGTVIRQGEHRWCCIILVVQKD